MSGARTTRLPALLLAASACLPAQQPHAAAAVDPQLWSLAPLPDVAAAPSAARIDALVQEQLANAQLAPAPPADRRTLLRRASFALTGLPPTPAELAAFEADAAPDAFDRVVDRLLASTACAEHLARRWLDLARYSDSNGLDENLAFANAWRYRDWVVRAFADDLPFDRFGTLQLAGDLLPDDDPAPLEDRLVATGFLALGPRMLAEQDKEKLVLDTVDEQLDLYGRTFLGITMGCARCHDHKFDPVPTRDYYALAGIFKSTRAFENLDHVSRWVERPLAAADVLAAREAAVAAAAAAAAAATEFERGASAALPARIWPRIGDALLAGVDAAGTAVLREAESADATNLRADAAQWGAPGCTVLHTVAAGVQFAEYRVRVAAGRHRLDVRLAAAEARPLRILVDGDEVLPRALAATTGGWLPAHQRWHTAGEFDLTAGDHVLRLEALGPHAPHLDRLILAPITEPPWPAAAAVPRDLPPALVRNSAFLVQDPDTALGRDFAGSADDATAASPAAAAARWQVLLATAWQALLELQQQHSGASADLPTRLPTPSLDAARLLAVGPGGLFALEPDERRALWSDADRRRHEALQAARVAAEAAVPPAPPTAMCVRDGDAVDLPIHLRGNHLTLAADPVPRGVLSATSDVVPSPSLGPGSGRLELARWTFDPRQPLTPRVAVNRVWQWAFGDGLCASESNFGVRGALPSHPRLLDELAAGFVRDGWSVRRLLRELLRTRTWQQRSDVTDARAAEVDPENRLLWRARRQRLPAEAIRDAVLAVAGTLDRSVGGSLLQLDNRAYVTNDQSRDAARYDVPRRSLYLPVIRNAMYELFTVFDYADPSVHLEQRPQSAVATQALLLLNSPFVRAQSRAFAAAAAAAADPEPRIDWIWRQALQRPPSADERAAARRWLDGAPAEQAWPGLCQAVLATNEFVYID
ncbi:MAG: DUF1553 domain-containing protein [Planctomycetota bacterium]